MKWLNVTNLHFTEKFINKVRFEQLMAVSPQCSEDTNGADFENWIYNFAESKQPELYVNFPNQIEAFPIHFEDPFSIYKLETDSNTGALRVLKLRQDKTADQFRVHCNIIRGQYQERGIHCPDFNTIVLVSALCGTEYDEMSNTVYKVYSQETFNVPFNLVIRKRPSNHYLNVNERTTTGFGRIKPGTHAICFNQNLLCVMGKIKSRDPKNQTVKIAIDRQSEEQKIHNPFLAENFLRRELTEMGLIKDQKGHKKTQPAGMKRYYGD